ncbi:MAG: glycosyltransferase 61 family protein [Proteobacteria bacterium]|nr:glycosyltransferase 61 family protein [Pseudomonadota bacterium]
MDITSAELLDDPGARTSARVFRMEILAGGQRIPAPQYLWATDSIAGIDSSVAPALHLYFANDVLLHGPAVLQSGGERLASNSINPPYVDDYIETGEFYRHYGGNYLPLEESRKLPQINVGQCFVVHHFNYAVYGHALLEILPKLFVIRQLPQLSQIPILVPARCPGWYLALVKLVCPRSPLLIYDPKLHSVRIGRAILPPWGGGDKYLVHPFLIDQCRKLLATVRSGKPFNATRLLLLRNQPHSFRLLENQREIEMACQPLGFIPVYPEKLSFSDQAQLFESAELIVGEFGSALHNCIFSKPGTKIVALNRLNELQDLIAAVGKQKIGYVLPVGGRPVLFDDYREETLRYRVDVQELITKLQSLTST